MAARKKVLPVQSSPGPERHLPPGPLPPGRGRTERLRKVLIAECAHFSSRAAELLRAAFDVTLADLDRPALLQKVREAEVLWIRLRHRIDAEVLAAAPNLRAIVSPTTGLNHIDLKAAARRKIRIISLQGETAFLQDVRATAEHTLALMLALLRQIPEASAHVRAGGWDRGLFQGRELYGKTVGIVGLGRLGRIVARYLQAFEMRVLATDPHAKPAGLQAGVRLAPLRKLLGEADIVTLHVNLNDQTRGFFAREQFAAMKRGAWFINTSRGELVDEDAFLESLRTGHLGGAAIDVVSDERPPSMSEHPLVEYARDHSHLLITPHIGGATQESMEKTENFLAEKLCKWLETKSKR